MLNEFIGFWLVIFENDGLKKEVFGKLNLVIYWDYSFFGLENKIVLFLVFLVKYKVFKIRYGFMKKYIFKGGLMVIRFIFKLFDRVSMVFCRYF